MPKYCSTRGSLYSSVCSVDLCDEVGVNILLEVPVEGGVTPHSLVQRDRAICYCDNERLDCPLVELQIKVIEKLRETKRGRTISLKLILKVP